MRPTNNCTIKDTTRPPPPVPPRPSKAVVAEALRNVKPKIPSRSKLNNSLENYSTSRHLPDLIRSNDDYPKPKPRNLLKASKSTENLATCNDTTSDKLLYNHLLLSSSSELSKSNSNIFESSNSSIVEKSKLIFEKPSCPRPIVYKSPDLINQYHTKSLKTNSNIEKHKQIDKNHFQNSFKTKETNFKNQLQNDDNDNNNFKEQKHLLSTTTTTVKRKEGNKGLNESMESIYGKIKSNYEKKDDGGGFEYNYKQNSDSNKLFNNNDQMKYNNVSSLSETDSDYFSLLESSHSSSSTILIIDDFSQSIKIGNDNKHSIHRNNRIKDFHEFNDDDDDDIDKKEGVIVKDGDGGANIIVNDKKSLVKINKEPVIIELKQNLSANENSSNSSKGMSNRIQQSDWFEVADNGAQVRFSSCKIIVNDSTTHSGGDTIIPIIAAKDTKTPQNRIQQREKKMSSSLPGLPPLPKSLSGFNISSAASTISSSSQDDKVRNENASQLFSTSSSSSSSASHRSKNLTLQTVNDSSSINDGKKLFTSLDTKLAILKREMFGLRQLDLSLLSQLWSLNEAIQDFRQLLQEQDDDAALSPPSPSFSGGSSINGEEEYFSPTSTNPFLQSAPLAPQLRCTGNSSSANSSEYGTV